MAGTQAVAVTLGLVVFASVADIVADIVPAAGLAVGVAVSAAWPAATQVGGELEITLE